MKWEVEKVWERTKKKQVKGSIFKKRYTRKNKTITTLKRNS